MKSVFAFVALLAVASAASPPTVAPAFSVQGNLTILYQGGYTHNSDATIFQSDNTDSGTKEYAATIVDPDTGLTFREGYHLGNVGCINFQIVSGQCTLGCKASTPCGGHSCSCGAAAGVFEYLPKAVAAGDCGSGNTLWTAQVDHTDDDVARAATFEFCFASDSTPVFLRKAYVDSTPDTEQPLGRFLGNDRVSRVEIMFSNFTAGAQPSSVFQPPAGCLCQQ